MLGDTPLNAKPENFNRNFMKTYITNIFERIKNYSNKLDDLTLLTNKHWAVFNENSLEKIVYIFQKNGVLLISVNGKITKSKWEYIGENSLMIDIKQESYLFKQGFIDDNLLALKIDGIKEYAILYDESKINANVPNLSYLEDFIQDYYILNSFASNNENQKYLKINGSDVRIIDGFNENYAVIINDNLDYGFINENKEIVQECIFEYAENFSCSLALVRKNNKFGYIDKSFNYLIEPIYDVAKSFNNNVAEVNLDNRNFKINTTGIEINKNYS